MSFSEFPFDAASRVGMTWPITRSPIQKALVQTSASGKEYRQPLYAFPRWKWKIDFGYLWDDYSNPKASTNFMFQTLAGFFNQVQGQYLSWLYLDPWDNQATAQPCGFATGAGYQFTGNGVQTTGWQLFKTQSGGPVEPVQQVQTLSGSNSIFFNGVPQTGYGLVQGPPSSVNLASAPGNGVAVTWTGNFYYLCRFTADSFDFSHDWYGMYSAKAIEFESVLG